METWNTQEAIDRYRNSLKLSMLKRHTPYRVEIDEKGIIRIINLDLEESMRFEIASIDNGRMV